jgi:hypothetical protein
MSVAVLGLLLQLSLLWDRLAESHARLASGIVGSLVLFVVKALREAREVHTMTLMFGGTLALGVILGVALEAGLRRGIARPL